MIKRKKAEPTERVSQTLSKIDESLRPAQDIICKTCQHSNWFLSEGQVKCYCKGMFIIVYSTANPRETPMCDKNFD